MRDFDGRSIVVTGGSLGIGYACAEELVSRGARVVVCARSREALDDAHRRLDQIRTGSVRSVVADVSVDNDVKTLFELAESDRPVDGVVHAAAILGPIGTVVDIEPSDWLQAIQVDLYGTFLVTRRACQSMIMAGRAGSIVLLSGGGAATPFPRYTAYASSKAGVARFAETAALEMAAHGIRVNCLAPGFVATRLHQQTLDAGERAGTYGERTANLLTTGGVPPTVAARAAAFLLSDRAKDITGRFVAAPYDDWEQWPAHASELQDSDLFTLRRIVPRDRGRDWQ